MPFLRIVLRGAVLALRSKRRTYAFMVLFMVLSAWTILQVARLEAYGTDNLVRLRGIVLEPLADGGVADVSSDVAYDKLLSLEERLSGLVDGIYVVYFYELIPGELGMITVAPLSSAYSADYLPWVLEEFKPSKVVLGRYIEGDGEGLVNSGFSIDVSGSGGVTCGLSGGIGFTLRVSKDDKVSEIKVVGYINSSQIGFDKLRGGKVDNIVFVKPALFRDIMERVMGLSNVFRRADVLVRRVVVVVSGGFLLTDLRSNLQEAYSRISDIGGDLAPFAITAIEPIDPANYQSDLMLTFIVIMMAFLMGILYAYIIVRFRHKDIAVLRAIGWSKRDVHLLMLGEFMYVMLLGYFFSVLISSMYTIILRTYQLTAISLLISLLIVLVAILFGYVFISKRVLKISPMEAFRGVGV